MLFVVIKDFLKTRPGKKIITSNGKVSRFLNFFRNEMLCRKNRINIMPAEIPRKFIYLLNSIFSVYVVFTKNFGVEECDDGAPG